MNDSPYSLIIIVIIGIYSFTAILSFINAPKCKHGIRNGNYVKNNKCKCTACQIEREEYLAKIKRENEWKHHRLEIERTFRNCVVNAIKKRRECLCSDINMICGFSPSEFEDLVANLYRRMGYEVKQTPYTNDGGKDAFIEKNGIKYLLECKRYSPKAHIGRPLLQKLYAAMNEEHIQYGVFVTTADFSKEAIQYGIKYNILTINGNKLIELLREHMHLFDMQYEYSIPCLTCGDMQAFSLLHGEEHKTCINGHRVDNIFYKNNNNSKICFCCGKKLELRTGYRGKFYGCSDYPQCRFTISPIDYQIEIGEKILKY